MTKPVLLDLFCGAGGAAMGYARAGFEVVGVDIKPQPHYPFEFHQEDAAAILRSPFLGKDVYVYGRPVKPNAWAAIHASPPCHDHSSLASITGEDGTGDLLALAAIELARSGVPYVIENVGAADMPNSVTLCGSSFGLGVRRHRKFIVSPPIGLVPPCAHHLQPEPLDVTGGGPSKSPRTDGKGGRSRKPRNIKEAGEAMGIDWMTRAELNQAIPPAYTELIGRHLIEQLERVA